MSEPVEAAEITFEELLGHLGDLEQLARDERFVVLAETLYRTRAALAVNPGRFGRRAARLFDAVALSADSVEPTAARRFADENTSID